MRGELSTVASRLRQSWAHVAVDDCPLRCVLFWVQAVPRQVTAPSPEALAQLVAMGFEEQRASNALQQANNDLQTALALLL